MLLARRYRDSRCLAALPRLLCAAALAVCSAHAPSANARSSTAHAAPAIGTAAPCPPSWQVIPVLPAGLRSSLYGVSAPAAHDVWAVGSLHKATTEFALIEHWDGSAWSQTLPNVPGISSRLLAVAALPAGEGDFVWAAGNTTPRTNPTGTPFIAYHNLGGWQIQYPPVPSLADGAPEGYSLTGIAADAANDAWAVGANFSGTQLLIEHWNGNSWQIVPVPGFGPGRLASLQAVTALSAKDVWAAGARTGDTVQPLVLHYDGTTWREVPIPAGDAPASLRTIAATSTHDIWTAGPYDGSAASSTLLEHWDGSSWRIVPNLPYGSSIRALAAVKPGNIWAVAAPEEIMQSNGNQWIALRQPTAPALDGVLDDVAAVARNNIWAVGTTSPMGSDALQVPEGLVEHYTGAAPCLIPNPVAISVVLGDTSSSLVVDVKRDRTFVRTDDGKVEVFDTLRHALIASVAVGTAYGGTMALDERTGRVFVTNTGDRGADFGSVAVLDAATGKPVNRIPPTDQRRHPITVAIDEALNRAYVVNLGSFDGSLKGSITILNAQTGTVMGTLPAGDFPTTAVVDAQRHLLFVANQGDSTVTVVGEFKQTVSTVALTDPTDGQPALPRGGTPAPMAIDEGSGHLFIGEAGSRVGILDDSRSQVTATSVIVNACGPNDSPPAITAVPPSAGSAGRMAVACGQLVLLDARNGQPLATYEVGALPTAIAFDTRSGRLLVTHLDSANSSGDPTGPGAVSIVDPRLSAANAVVASAVVGWGPSLVVDDAASNQAVILNQTVAGGDSPGSVSFVRLSGI